MGLIQAALSATTGAISDQWKEYFYCDALPSDVIAVKGHKKVRGFGSNNGDDNIISDGSVIAVADGQCMLIVENGKVVDICAEPGEFRYDSMTEPSVFTGPLSESVANVFAQIGKRFQFGGQPAQDQRVYYFNTKELLGVKYGTPNPIPYRIVDNDLGLKLDSAVSCFGEYSLKVVDPILFYTNVCGNFDGVFKVSEIESQLKTELLTALQPALGRLSAEGVGYTQLPLHAKEITTALNEELSEAWRDQRGLEIGTFGLSSATISEEDQERIKALQEGLVYKDPAYAAGGIASATATAIKDAAKNEGGAILGVANMNAVSQATGSGLSELYAMGNKPTVTNGWACPKCGTENTGKFCTECGTANPNLKVKWICPKCNTENDGKFCTECGTQKPE